MADRRRDTQTPAHHGAVPHDVPRSAWGEYYRTAPTASVVASAQVMPFAEQNPSVTQLQPWQQEAWSFYENLGEFSYAVDWFSEALSRIRLIAAEMVPGGDEPVPLEDGPAVELMESFAGGTDVQTAIMRSAAIQLSVPGECYLVGRKVSDAELYGDLPLDAMPDADGVVWTVQPKHTLRQSRRTIKTMLGRRRRGWELQVDDVTWIPLPAESLVTRLWDRDERIPWRASSAARSALPIMREVDMYNRYIIATLVSRAALNGLLLIPDEVTLPVNPEYSEEADPFIAELLDVMRATLKNPGSAASAAPLPIRVPADYVDRFKHLTFSTPMDERIFDARRDALNRLASSLNVPKEVLTGLGDTSHWNAWQIEESAIKVHLAPKTEVITRCLTIGYLHPMLRAMNESTQHNGSNIIVWYDPSSLTQRPDRSDLALQLRDRLVINDDATRRETGFSEDDAPSDDDLNDMVLRALALNPAMAAIALKELTGLDLGPAPSEQPGEAPLGGSLVDGGPTTGELPSGTRNMGNEPTREPPDTQGEPPPPSNGSSTITAGANGVDSERYTLMITDLQQILGNARERVTRR